MNFLLTWYFPLHQQQRDQAGGMNGIRDFGKLRRHYAGWFASAAEVAQAVAARFEELTGTTRLWNRGWYDSTPPHWLLDREFLPVDCLASQTFHWFDSGRIWRGLIDEFVALADLRKRSLWVRRACTTRWRMVSDFSPVAALENNSRKSTSGTSTCRSTRLCLPSDGVWKIEAGYPRAGASRLQRALFARSLRSPANDSVLQQEVFCC